MYQSTIVTFSCISSVWSLVDRLTCPLRPQPPHTDPVLENPRLNNPRGTLLWLVQKFLFKKIVSRSLRSVLNGSKLVMTVICFRGRRLFVAFAPTWVRDGAVNSFEVGALICWCTEGNAHNTSIHVQDAHFCLVLRFCITYVLVTMDFGSFRMYTHYFLNFTDSMTSCYFEYWSGINIRIYACIPQWLTTTDERDRTIFVWLQTVIKLLTTVKCLDQDGVISWWHIGFWSSTGMPVTQIVWTFCNCMHTWPSS